MISSTANLETMPRKLRPRGRRLASQGLEESQEGATHEEPPGVEASAGGMEVEATSGAIHGALKGNLQLVWMKACALVMQCGN